MNVLVAQSKNNRLLLAMDKFQKLATRWMTRDEMSLLSKSDDQKNINKYAAFFYILHEDYGLTGNQLVELYDKYLNEYAPTILTDIKSSVENISEVDLLKDIGVDLEVLYKEGCDL